MRSVTSVSKQRSGYDFAMDPRPEPRKVSAWVLVAFAVAGAILGLVTYRYTSLTVPLLLLPVYMVAAVVVYRAFDWAVNVRRRRGE